MQVKRSIATRMPPNVAPVVFSQCFNYEAQHAQEQAYQISTQFTRGRERPENLLSIFDHSESSLYRSGQCRRKPEWGPRTTAIGPQFSGELFSVATLLNNDRLLVVTVHEVHVYGPFT